MAVIDAVATSIGTPLWRFFGGVSNTITTDITVQFLSMYFNVHAFYAIIFSNIFQTSFTERHNIMGKKKETKPITTMKRR